MKFTDRDKLKLTGTTRRVERNLLVYPNMKVSVD